MIDSGNLPAPYPHPNNSSGTLKERNHLYLPLLTHYANIIPTFFAYVNLPYRRKLLGLRKVKVKGEGEQR